MSVEQLAILATFGSGVVISLVAIIAGIGQARRKRYLEHVERMKAIELGREWPGDRPGSAVAARPAQTPEIGLFVPLGALGIAWLAAGSGPNTAWVWMAAGAVGVTALICGTILSLRQPNPAPAVVAKSPMEPDALDVAGRRG